MNNDTTIVAISTAPGIGGIAVIRVSGKDSFKIVQKHFVSPNNKTIEHQATNTLLYGYFNSNGNIIDEVLISIFKAPNSFTGENTIEISCHGSLFIQQKIVESLIEAGAVLAKPGEFTQRAFLNGKMDLSQAESVADLISSSNEATHKLALSQMRGGFSKKLLELRKRLIDFISLIELELDFSEEDVEFADRDVLINTINEISEHIRKLIDSFSMGNAIKNGIPIAIIGETNAGKSTLLNILLNEEKAIVSNIHGTTRDVIEDIINIGGVTFRLIDTAGIRETKDEIESIGIERTLKKISEVSIVLWVIDATTDENKLNELAKKINPLIEDKKSILVFNKVDKIDKGKQRTLESVNFGKFDDRIFISAQNNININLLEKEIVKLAAIPQIGNQDIIVTNMRHYEALKLADESLQRVVDGLQMEIPTDFIAQDIRQCMHYLGEITGVVANDEILGNIFANFCIGK